LLKKPDIICIGSVLWDIIGRAPVDVAPGGDVPGRITRLPGGVALNIAMTVARFGLTPAVLTAIGRDSEGEELLQAASARGVDCSFVHRVSGQPTDRYMAIEGEKGLVAAIADAHTLEGAGADILAALTDGRLAGAAAPWTGLVAFDGNLTETLLEMIAQSPAFRAADVRIVPAAPGKATRLHKVLPMANATAYLNLEEAGLLCATRFATSTDAAAALLARGARRVLVTNGDAVTADGSAELGILSAQPRAVRVRRVTGAGDTFMGAHILAEHQGLDRPTALQRALDAAATYVSGEIGT
jgi:pseudouridine kinase